MWVYIQSELTLWTVGFYDPQGKWEPESDHSSEDAAADRVRWLNGEDLVDTLEDIAKLPQHPCDHAGNLSCLEVAKRKASAAIERWREKREAK